MSLEAYLTAGVLIAMFVALLRDLAPADMVFLAGLFVLSVFGVITTEEAFSGFSNTGMLTVAFLFIVAAALRETGMLDHIGHTLLAKAKTERGAIGKLSVLILPLSAFLNNTPIVAMFMPLLIDWGKRIGISPSRLLLPLSYLAILGGTCTLIGTSTNIVIDGLLQDSGYRGLSLFEISVVGIPYALIGAVYLFIFAPKLLPVRKDAVAQLGEEQREYIIEMLVEDSCRLSGKSVEDSGLRGLSGLFLIEIERDGQSIAPVRPEEIIEKGDRLIFTGIVQNIAFLEQYPGLTPVADPNYEINPSQQRKRRLWEAVISSSSPLVGRSLKEADFRATYGAAVVAVRRGGQRIVKKIGDIVLRAGDTVLLQAGRHFRRAFRNDPAFYLISDVREWRPLRTDKVLIASVIFLSLLTTMTLNLVPIVVAVGIAALLMVLAGCISSSDARRSIDWQVLITIAAAFGIGAALENSGLAKFFAGLLVEFSMPYGPIAAIAAVYLAAAILTELITNNAAAVLLFPFCLETAKIYEVDPLPFVITLIFAASASFLTPIGYQTNMMVYGPGGYKFSDFIKLGLPLSIILWIVAVILIPYFWPF